MQIRAQSCISRCDHSTIIIYSTHNILYHSDETLVLINATVCFCKATMIRTLREKSYGVLLQVLPNSNWGNIGPFKLIKNQLEKQNTHRQVMTKSCIDIFHTVHRLQGIVEKFWMYDTITKWLAFVLIDFPRWSSKFFWIPFWIASCWIWH